MFYTKSVLKEIETVFKPIKKRTGPDKVFTVSKSF